MDTRNTPSPLTITAAIAVIRRARLDRQRAEANGNAAAARDALVIECFYCGIVHGMNDAPRELRSRNIRDAHAYGCAQHYADGLVRGMIERVAAREVSAAT